MVEVKKEFQIILLRSNRQKFFKFDAGLISKKYSQKFSAKQKSLVGCSYFCNPHRLKLARLNIANDQIVSLTALTAANDSCYFT